MLAKLSANDYGLLLCWTSVIRQPGWQSPNKNTNAELNSK
jgi:hypothetical protein